MQMNGIAHIGITVSNFKKCNLFYRQLFAFLEMQLIYDFDEVIYGVGSRTGIAVKEAENKTVLVYTTSALELVLGAILMTCTSFLWI